MKKFYDMWKKCIHGKIFWNKHAPRVPFKELKDMMLQVCSDKTLPGRDHFIFADVCLLQVGLEKLLKGTNPEIIDAQYKFAAAVTRSFLDDIGKSLRTAEKIYIPKTREAQFEKVDVAEDFTISDLDLDSPKVFMLESQPDTLFAVVRHPAPSVECSVPKYRWMIVGIKPKDGMDFFVYQIYTEGEDMTIAEVFERARHSLNERALYEEDREKVMSKGQYFVPLLVKAILYMTAVTTEKKNRHPEADRIRQTKKMDPKRKKKLLRAAPEFTVVDLSLKSSAQNKSGKLKDSEGKNIRGHWVRGYFRKQRYGEGRKLVKRIFIEPFFKGDPDNLVDRINKL